MSTRTRKIYSITMPPELGRQAEQVAKEESRSMSELMREAFRKYQIEKAERQLLAHPMRSKRLAEFRHLLTNLQQEAKRKGLDKTSVQKINTDIAATRRPQARKKK